MHSITEKPQESTTRREVVHGAMQAAYDAGLSVFPCDANKQPLSRLLPVNAAGKGSNESFFIAPPGEETFGVWMKVTIPSYGIAGGPASGGLLIIDFETTDAYHQWVALVGELPNGALIVKTPGGGIHVYFRMKSVGPFYRNEKLAFEPDDTQDSGRAVLIETRAEGGYVLGPGSIHPNGGIYEIVSGAVDSIPTKSQAEADAMLIAARRLDSAPLTRQQLKRMNKAQERKEVSRAANNGSADVIGEFNRRFTVRNVLRDRGYCEMGDRMIRPGATPGSQPGVVFFDRDGLEVCYAWSSNDQLNDGHSHTAFSAFCQLDHVGNCSEAVKAAADVLGMKREQRSESGTAEAAPQKKIEINSVRQLMQLYPQLRPPIIHGLLRRGETMNIIAPPKTGKSWLVTDLAISVATGRMWLGKFQTEAGNVLILDNELHGETSAARIPKVANGRGVLVDEFADHVHVHNLRGKWEDIFSLRRIFDGFKPGQFKVIILDAWYRFLPGEWEENSNNARPFNAVDSYADQLGCCFVLIHHSTKGNQASKEVTAVGAGGGTQARATDAHFILRQHEEDGVVVADAAIRSWQPIEPFCLRWDFPVWNLAPELDPNQLRQEGRRRKRVEPTEPAETPVNWTAELFTTRFISAEPKTESVIVATTSAIPKFSAAKAKMLLRASVDSGLAFKWEFTDRRKPSLFATQPQPVTSI